MDILVVRWRELVAFAGSPAKAKLLVRDGLYRRVLRDAYVLGDVPDSPEVRRAALARVVPEHAVLSHWTSLWAFGLDVLPRDAAGLDLLDLTVPRGLRLAERPGVRTHSALVTDDEVCEVDGLLIVSPARGFVDVARSYGLVEGVACGDAALRAGLATHDLLAEAVDRAGGLRWVTRARDALPHLDGRSESLMESRIRVDYVLAGGPRLAAQVDLYDDEGRHCARSDLFGYGVSIEYDGREQRLEKAAFTGDRRRGNGVADLEVEVRRLTAWSYWGQTREQRLAELLRAIDVARRRTRPRLRFGPDTLRRPRLTPPLTRAQDQRRAA